MRLAYTLTMVRRPPEAPRALPEIRQINPVPPRRIELQDVLDSSESTSSDLSSERVSTVVVRQAQHFSSEQQALPSSERSSEYIPMQNREHVTIDTTGSRSSRIRCQATRNEQGGGIVTMEDEIRKLLARREKQIAVDPNLASFQTLITDDPDLGEKYLCPISGGIMACPVNAPIDGESYIYEKSQVMRAVATSHRHPATNKAHSSAELAFCMSRMRDLQSEILKWLKLNTIEQ